MQILHADQEGFEATVSVFFDTEETTTSPFLKDLGFDVENLDIGHSMRTLQADDVLVMEDTTLNLKEVSQERLIFSKLIGTPQEYVMYEGSSTTPPC